MDLEIKSIIINVTFNCVVHFKMRLFFVATLHCFELADDKTKKFKKRKGKLYMLDKCFANW